MLRVALEDPLNQRFLLVSEVCIPLYPPTVMYAQLMGEDKSRLNACAKEGWHTQSERSAPCISALRLGAAVWFSWSCAACCWCLSACAKGGWHRQPAWSSPANMIACLGVATIHVRLLQHWWCLVPSVLCEGGPRSVSGQRTLLRLLAGMWPYTWACRPLSCAFVVCPVYLHAPRRHSTCREGSHPCT